MKQQCSLVVIYLTWALYAVGLIALLVKGDYTMAVLWLALVPLALWGYVRAFPTISRYMGYGSMQDRPAMTLVAAPPTKVTFYTALGCPFCPIVKRRLLALQGQSGFELAEVDVTTRPGLLTAKGIMSVPVVEVGETRLVGNATSEQLARLIQGSTPARA